MTPEQMEARIAALEAAVAELRKSPPKPRLGLDRFIGAFDDEPAFDDVVRYGREFRESQPIAGDPPS